MKQFDNLLVYMTSENESKYEVQAFVQKKFPRCKIVEVPIYYEGRRRFVYGPDFLLSILNPFCTRVQDSFIAKSKESHQHRWSFDMFVMNHVIDLCEKQKFPRRAIGVAIPQNEWAFLESHIKSTFLPPLESLRQYVTEFESYAKLFIARTLYAVALDHFYVRDTDEDPRKDLYKPPVFVINDILFFQYVSRRFAIRKGEERRLQLIRLNELQDQMNNPSQSSEHSYSWIFNRRKNSIYDNI